MTIVYDFNVPYVGGSVLSLKNTGSAEVTLDGLHFSGNIDSGTPYGSLFPYNTKFTQHKNEEGGYDYVLEFPQPLSIAPKQQLDLNMPYTQVSGVLPVAMDPLSVNVIQGGKVQPVEISDHCQGQACQDPSPYYRHKTYYANWDIYQRKYFVKDLPVDKINEVIYAFINYDKQGNIKLIDPNSDDKELVELSKLRRRYPYLNGKLSVGGWTLSADFSAMAANPLSRINFVNQTVKAMHQLNLNGIDIDWEYPVARGGAPGDACHFAQLLEEIHERQYQLTQQTQQSYSVSIAAPGGVDKIDIITKDCPSFWQSINEAKVQMNVMNYDYHGGFDTIVDNQSPMKTDPRDPNFASEPGRSYAVVPTLDRITKTLGVDPAQVILGYPIYARTMLASDMTQCGLWSKVTGVPMGQYDKTGMFDTKCVINSECGSGQALPPDMQFLPAITNALTNVSQVPLACSVSKKLVATYDDPISIKNKAAFVKQQPQPLGGMFSWLASGDSNVPEYSLINSAHQTLNEPTTLAPVVPQLALALVLPKMAANAASALWAVMKKTLGVKQRSYVSRDLNAVRQRYLQRLNKLHAVLPGLSNKLQKQWKQIRRALGRDNLSYAQQVSVLRVCSRYMKELNSEVELMKEKKFSACLLSPGVELLQPGKAQSPSAVCKHRVSSLFSEAMPAVNAQGGSQPIAWPGFG
jgi:chitinase